jgi:hypothetical protein
MCAQYAAFHFVDNDRRLNRYLELLELPDGFLRERVPEFFDSLVADRHFDPIDARTAGIKNKFCGFNQLWADSVAFDYADFHVGFLSIAFAVADRRGKNPAGAAARVLFRRLFALSCVILPFENGEKKHDNAKDDQRHGYGFIQGKKNVSVGQLNGAAQIRFTDIPQYKPEDERCGAEAVLGKRIADHARDERDDYIVEVISRRKAADYGKEDDDGPEDGIRYLHDLAEAFGDKHRDNDHQDIGDDHGNENA